jgi:predicted Zn-dependent protease
MVKFLSFIWLGVTLGLAGCAHNPVSGKTDFVMMSEQQEVQAGVQGDAGVRQKYAVYDAPALQEYVNRVGQKVAAHSHRANLQYHFTVLDSPEINAFALPGGYVYITRGILAYLNSEAELAAVLGHEIGHVTARHGVRQASAAQAANIGFALASILLPQVNPAGLGQNVAKAWLSGYGRDHELEADRLGADYLARSGYDPQAMIRVVGVLKNQELFDAQQAQQEGREPRRYHGTFDTHPDADTRLQQVVAEANHLTVAQPVEGRREFLHQISGLVFGDSTAQGILRDNQFMHAALNVSLTFPLHWRVQNSAESVVALSPAADASIQLQMDTQPSGSPAEYARRMVEERYIEHVQIDGYPAAIAHLPQGMVGFIAYNGSMMMVQCAAQSPTVVDTHYNAMRQTLLSFHRLTPREQQQAQALTLRVIRAQNGDTYARLAKHSPLGKNAESILRLINAHYPQGEPRVGESIKIVE